MTIETRNNFDALQAAAENQNKVHLVVQADRPGSRLFTVKLEYEHYPPRSGKNKYFDLHLVHWPMDDNDKPLLLWFVVGIPKGDMYLAEKIAKECGLKITNGIPIVLSHKGQENFPMDSPNVYGIETNSKSNLYKNDSALYKKMMEGESAECERILKADENKIRSELTAEGHTPAQIDSIIAEWLNGVELVEASNPLSPLNDGQHRLKRK